MFTTVPKHDSWEASTEEQHNKHTKTFSTDEL